jgi:hypothetical protein
LTHSSLFASLSGLLFFVLYVFTSLVRCSNIYFPFRVIFAGDCINSSPAGKRRIAAEKQLSQLADEGNLFNGDAALMDGSVGGAASADQIKSPVAFVALVAVAICSVFVIVFVAIFTVLQVSTRDAFMCPGDT